MLISNTNQAEFSLMNFTEWDANSYTKKTTTPGEREGEQGWVNNLNNMKGMTGSYDYQQFVWLQFSREMRKWTSDPESARNRTHDMYFKLMVKHLKTLIKFYDKSNTQHTHSLRAWHQTATRSSRMPAPWTACLLLVPLTHPLTGLTACTPPSLTDITTSTDTRLTHGKTSGVTCVTCGDTCGTF